MSYHSRIAHLEQRRALLVANTAAQRVALAGAADAWRGPLAVADRGIAVVRFFKQYPAMLAAVAVVALVLKPGPTWRWGRRGYLAWRTWRAFVRPDANPR
ncbi:MAG: YqjK-like family protein [Burkholderiales bacterium]